MALHTQAEFCKMLGISKDYLKSYKRRDKVVLKDGKYIDDTHPINLAFMQSRKPKKNIEENVQLEKPATEIKALVSNDVVLSENCSRPADESSIDVRNLNYNELVTEEKAEKILKTREEREVVKLKKEKMLGESLPIEPVKRLVLLLSESIFSAVEQEFEDHVITFAAQYGLSRTEIADMRKDNLNRINNARVKAVEEAKKAIRKVQIEYSAKKGRGER